MKKQCIKFIHVDTYMHIHIHTHTYTHIHTHISRTHITHIYYTHTHTSKEVVPVLGPYFMAVRTRLSRSMMNMPKQCGTISLSTDDILAHPNYTHTHTHTHITIQYNGHKTVNLYQHSRE